MKTNKKTQLQILLRMNNNLNNGKNIYDGIFYKNVNYGWTRLRSLSETDFNDFEIAIRG